jgi:hypothetical protein
MSELKDFFEQRKNEVNIYFKFIDKLGIDNINQKKINFSRKSHYIIDDNLKKILKSNAIIILYNLIEGVVSKSIEYILDDINDSNIKYNELKPYFKQLILKTTSKVQKKDFEDRNDNLVQFIDQIFDEIFMLEFIKNKRVILKGGGNIDAKFIREKIAEPFDIRFNRKEATLLEIKTARNHLAHGSKSFVEFSQNKTFKEIKKQKTKIFTYLKDYVLAIDKYVKNKSYLNK